jgi:hypothetical protein
MRSVFMLCLFLISASGYCQKNKMLDRSLRNSVIDYVERFNAAYPEIDSTYIPNKDAASFILSNVPLFNCPDSFISRTYYFRWWSYRKHIRKIPGGFVVTEFLPNVEWAGPYNSINCPVVHQLSEGRWIRDTTILIAYARFWFSHPGADPGGSKKLYSLPMADAIDKLIQVNGSATLGSELFPLLANNYRNWQSKDGGGDSQARKSENGLYWQIDSWDGMEFSISGEGYRSTINSYMYGDAMALAALAMQLGRSGLEREFRNDALNLKENMTKLMWDSSDGFFKTVRGPQKPQYENRFAEKLEPYQRSTVKELVGYLPWLYDMPDTTGKFNDAWKYLRDTTVFLGRKGLRTADRHHPNFSVADSGECNWNGASWPFTTTQTLTALGNHLNRTASSAVSAADYFTLLRQYALSHTIEAPDGSVKAWIDESYHPETGKWISFGSYPNIRGRFYNHSAFCDLVITGLVGLRPSRTNELVVNPLVPNGVWDWFECRNINYKGFKLDVVWDRDGKKFKEGKGLLLFIDGKLAAQRESLGLIRSVLPGVKFQ